MLGAGNLLLLSLSTAALHGVIYCRSNRDQCMSEKDVIIDVIDTGGQFFTRVNDIGCQFAVCVKTPTMQFQLWISSHHLKKIVIALRALGEYDS